MIFRVRKKYSNSDIRSPNEGEKTEFSDSGPFAHAALTLARAEHASNTCDTNPRLCGASSYFPPHLHIMQCAMLKSPHLPRTCGLISRTCGPMPRTCGPGPPVQNFLGSNPWHSGLNPHPSKQVKLNTGVNKNENFEAKSFEHNNPMRTVSERTHDVAGHHNIIFVMIQFFFFFF
ncbi:hypothetical protein HYC85_029793 [Camellia sinensis]|uniref:Uncharacterized protein n=1 Tax=Camellia sinensis TaxID=4442 RepID=A0A7J7FYY6_CAMSI|nr:hypothetical protein HYC85_029793 [Camellia sinensis]